MDSLAKAPLVDETAVRLMILNKEKHLQQRIVRYSAALMGSFYQLHALGEGPAGIYDRNPLYRFDRFDCETYVSTVVAMAAAADFIDFKRKINQIRYQTVQVGFIQRNHFPSADWLPNNAKNGYVRELTYVLGGKKTKIATARITRRRWCQCLTVDRIQVPHASVSEKKILLAQLKKEGNKLIRSEKVSIAYIPITDILSNNQLQQRIPTGSLIFLVGHDTDLHYRIGTQMNVSHMGFAIWTKGRLYFRMASSRVGRVLDIPLENYLRAYHKLDHSGGISVWAMREPINQRDRLSSYSPQESSP